MKAGINLATTLCLRLFFEVEGNRVNQLKEDIREWLCIIYMYIDRKDALQELSPNEVRNSLNTKKQPKY